jgi:multiple sugar transport system permease protein
MSVGTDKRPPWYQRLLIHAILLGGGVFFVLPLVWMMSTSLKPLDQTMQRPESFATAFLPMGYSAAVDGKECEVVLERQMPKGGAFWIVRSGAEFPAGELTLPVVQAVWRSNPAFSRPELALMDEPVKPGMKVLADEKCRFDPNSGRLTLCSGTVVPAEPVRRVEVTGDDTWLVRQWLPADTDTKEMSANVIDVTRRWDILPRSAIREGVRPILENYPVALRRANFGHSLINTLFLCLMTVSGTVISSVLVAYGFAFLEFRGRNTLFALTLSTIMIPFVVTMVPVYLLNRSLGWVGTFKPLWVASWFGSAFFVFLLRQFFLGLPKDLLDAARIDGCSELEILWNVIVPLSRPVIAMVGLFTFLGTWKDFFGPLLYLNHPSQMTLALSLQAFASEHGGTPWHLLMAAATVFSLPLIILFFFTVKSFIQGVAMTGIKG